MANSFVPYGIKISNTKTKERVVIELEFGGSKQLYEYLCPIIHKWAGGERFEPIKAPPKLSDLALLETELKNCQKTIEELRKELKLAKL